MLNAPPYPRTVLDVVTDFLASDPSPEAVIAYRLPVELEERAHALLERKSEGVLTFDEEQEMSAYLHANQMMSLLKAKMRLKLRTTPDAR